MRNLLPFLFCIMPFMAPDTGGAGGGAPPGAVDLAEYARRMNEADKKGRPAIAGELAKALGVPIEEAFKKLKEAGWNPKEDQPPAGTPPGNNNGAPPDTGEKQTVTLRHKSPYPHYRRAGLVLTDQFKPYEVTALQLDALEEDSWVEIKKG
jgi:hypothetical protein